MPIFHSLPGRLTALLLAALFCGGAAAEAPQGIHVTGIGEIVAVPDMARLTLEVRREGRDAAALKAELDQVTGAVLELADELDIPRRDVTAAAVNIHPRYQRRNGDEQPEGVIASRTIEITLMELERIGELINGALERGANGVRGVALDASNRVKLEQQALDEAIDDAVREARQIAQRFNVNLGMLQDARAGHHQVQPLMMEAMSARSADKGSFSPGEMTIRREVQATFGIRR
ncbi:MAG: SIMPL domain-containing protein [Gammaproteobacteria bacterium]|nr:SIMPL domain-containing protein [Gammaproteobacteria bacterium]